MAKRAVKEQKPLDFEVLNQTELVTLARALVVEANHGMSREALIAIVEDGVVPDVPPRLLNKTRLKIMQYIDQNFAQLECLLSCPAKSRDPYSCFQCSDLQVASCTLENEKMFTTEEPESHQEEETMPNTVKIQSPSGEVDLQVLTADEIDTLLADNNPASRSQIMEHMKALGRPIGELIKMKPAERKAFILERYAELGLVTSGAKKATKGGTVTQLKPATAAKAAPAAVKAVKAAAPKAKAAEPEDEDEAEAALDGGSTALLESQRELIAALTELVQAQAERLDQITTQLDDMSKLVFDTHFIVRSALPHAAGLSDDDVINIGNENGVYGKLLAGEVEDDAEGND